MVNVIRVDGDKVGGNDSQIMVIDGEDECCLDRGIDQTEEIFLALEPKVSAFSKNEEDEWAPTYTRVTLYFRPPLPTPA